MLEILTHIGHSEKVFVMRVFIAVLVLIFGFQSWTKAEEKTEYITKKKQSSYITKKKQSNYITKKKQGSYITKKSKYITKKEIKKTNYKLLLLFPLGFIII